MKTQAILILGLCAVSALGCRPKARATVPPPSTPAVTNAAPPAEPPAQPAQPAAPAAQVECADDRECRDYLRCEENKCVVPPAVDGREVEGMPTATFLDGERELATFKLEIADEPWERTRGLMYRRKMHPDFGMLFVFEADEVRSFWMRNTLIPLDMVHIDSRGKVVGIVERAEPLTETPRQTGVPARYVLELTSGRAAEVGIKTGAMMRVTGLPEESSPQ